MRIELWHDETSDPADPVWCVSLCDDDGDEIMLHSYSGDYGRMRQAAIRAAQRRNLACVERDTMGRTTPIDCEVTHG